MAGDDGLPWNVSRCNRLLRPLSSKLAKLRKELEQSRTATQEPRTTSSAFATKATPQKTTNFTRPALKPRGFDKARDPDWRPGAKGTKRTYGGRRLKKLGGPAVSAHAEHVARPGEIAFTPLIARMGGRMLDSPIQASPLKKYSKPRGPLVVAIDPLEGASSTVPADVHKLVQGVLEAYANILHATEEKKSRKGTSPLMRACLKKLPAYIELEEHFAELDQLEDEEEEDRDMTSEIYTHLESRFEQRQGQGWQPFKHVVRAHGTALLCSAVEDGVIATDSLRHIHHHCLAMGAYDEAEELLLAALPSLEPLSIPTNVRSDLFSTHKTLYMAMAKELADRGGRYRFLYDLLEHMVAHELLPLEWLATTCMRPVWDRLVRTITESDQRTLASCSRFLETCALAGMGLPDERLLADEVTGSVARRFVPSSRDDLRQALNTTYSSLLTVLCSITLANNRDGEAGRDIAQRVIHTLDSIVITLASRSDIDAELSLLGAYSEDLHVFAQRASWAIFAAFLVRLENPAQNETTISLSTSSLIHNLSNIVCYYTSNGINSSTTLATLPTLISAVARGSGRIYHDSGFSTLQRLVQSMNLLSGHHLPHKLWTLKRIALESATEFAADTDEEPHLRYAHDIERQMSTSGRLVLMPTPRKTDTPFSTSGGFRWEDGIGEWVACTPFTRSRRPRDTRPLRKSLRTLSLLPTPAHSSSDPDDRASSIPDSDSDPDNAPILPSSPPAPSSPIRTTAAPLKRARCTSPIVRICVKRQRSTSSDATVVFYPEDPCHSQIAKARPARRCKVDLVAVRTRDAVQRRERAGLRGSRRVPRFCGAVVGTDSGSEDELSFGF